MYIHSPTYDTNVTNLSGSVVARSCTRARYNSILVTRLIMCSVLARRRFRRFNERLNLSRPFDQHVLQSYDHLLLLVLK